MRYTTAAIVSAHGELLASVPQRVHYCDTVASKGRLGIEAVVGRVIGAGFGGQAVTAEVNNNTGELVEKLGEDFVEDQVGLRVAV